MIAGIDPFADDDPMIIYQNILKGKLHFPKGFDNDAKSLVRHLLISDLSKRYGNLKNGVNDIKHHRYMNTINFNNLLTKKISPPYKPKVKSPGDTSNFTTYDDTNSEVQEIKPSDDPFKEW
jgi:protein kinase A